jgi:2-polyprenyl-3-methyl-5-hydroxy-6-metoxy-1,4-benzoquinol methylase
LISEHRNNKEFNDEIRRIWNVNAEWWDDKIGDGNEFQDKLIEPATESLLEIRPGDVVLDIACGSGRFTRRMARMGAHIVAFDFSEKFINRAREKTPSDLRIEYHVADAAIRGQITAFGTNRFDLAVCHMAIMDIFDIEPLFSALHECLKPKGHFVFSVIHPCFHSAGITKFSEISDESGKIVVRNGIKVHKYRSSFSYKALGIIGQPEPQYYFHRSLETLLTIGFKNGFVIDGLLEPGFDIGQPQRRGLRWRDMPEIPPILIVRMLSHA